MKASNIAVWNHPAGQEGGRGSAYRTEHRLGDRRGDRLIYASLLASASMMVALGAAAQGIPPPPRGMPPPPPMEAMPAMQPMQPMDPMQPAQGGGEVEGMAVPSRAARVSVIEGSVSFLPAGTQEWVGTQVNRPVTTGDRFWVDQGGRLELQVGGSSWRAAPGTEFEVARLDDDSADLVVSRGHLQLTVLSLFSGESIEVETPQLRLRIAEPANLRIDVADDGSGTRVTPRSGRVTVQGLHSGAYSVTPETATEFGGSDLTVLSSGPATVDEFERWAQARDAADARSVAAQTVGREMVGYQALDAYGRWDAVPEYGSVWYPANVSADWAPYRFGSWIWVAPWGWSWIDDQPWGFAPFHYGRWARIGGRWGWVPGTRAPRPVYAPALVSFWNPGAQLPRMGPGPGIAWSPLAPGEVYRPAYRHGPGYVERINRPFFGARPLPAPTVRPRFPEAVTAVPGSVFISGRPIGPSVHSGARGDVLRDLRPVQAPLPRPGMQSRIGAGQPGLRPPARSFPGVPAGPMPGAPSRTVMPNAPAGPLAPQPGPRPPAGMGAPGVGSQGGAVVGSRPGVRQGPNPGGGGSFPVPGMQSAPPPPARSPNLPVPGMQSAPPPSALPARPAVQMRPPMRPSPAPMPQWHAAPGSGSPPMMNRPQPMANPPQPRMNRPEAPSMPNRPAPMMNRPSSAAPHAMPPSMGRPSPSMGRPSSSAGRGSGSGHEGRR